MGRYGVFRDKYPDTPYLAWDARDCEHPFADRLAGIDDLRLVADRANAWLDLCALPWWRRVRVALRPRDVPQPVGESGS